MAFQPFTVPGFQPLLPARKSFEVLQQLILLEMPQHLEQILDFVPAMEARAAWPWELMGDKAIQPYPKNVTFGGLENTKPSAQYKEFFCSGTHATSTANISQGAALHHIAVVVALLTWATMGLESGGTWDALELQKKGCPASKTGLSSPKTKAIQPQRIMFIRPQNLKAPRMELPSTSIPNRIFIPRCTARSTSQFLPCHPAGTMPCPTCGACSGGFPRKSSRTRWCPSIHHSLTG